MDTIEKMHTDATGVVGPSGPDAKWLNSFDEVNGIVAGFTAELLKRFGQGKPDALMSWLETECRNLNTIFIGGGLSERPYEVDPAWNNPDRLGQRVLIRLGIEGENRHAVRDAFMVYADEITDLVVDHGDAPIEDWGWELGARQERLARALLDMPAGSDEDPDTPDEAPLSAD